MTGSATNQGRRRAPRSIVIRCREDESQPGGWLTEMDVVTEDGGEHTVGYLPMSAAPKQRGEARNDRTFCVFDEIQRPTWQALAMLVLIVDRDERARRDEAVPPLLHELCQLTEWERVRKGASPIETARKIVGDSRVLELSGDSVGLRPEMSVNFDGERADALRWAGVRPTAADTEPDPGAVGDTMNASEPPPSSRKQQFEADLAALEAEVLTWLLERPRVALEIAREVGVDAPLPREPTRVQEAWAEELARVLVHKKQAEELVNALSKVDAQLVKDASRIEDRKAIKSLAWRLLPFVTDWRELVLNGRRAIKYGDKVVNLPFRKSTMAEVVLAGIECRACRFSAIEEELPLGDAIVRMPLALRPFIDFNGEKAAQAALMALAMTLLHLDVHDRRIRENDPQLIDEIDERLEHACTDPYHKQVVRYLLLDEHVIREVGTASGEDRIAAVVSATGKLLPSLRFVRLGKGVKREVFISVRIGTMWQEGPG